MLQHRSTHYIQYIWYTHHTQYTQYTQCAQYTQYIQYIWYTHHTQYTQYTQCAQYTQYTQCIQYTQCTQYTYNTFGVPTTLVWPKLEAIMIGVLPCESRVLRSTLCLNSICRLSTLLLKAAACTAVLQVMELMYGQMGWKHVIHT